MSTTDKKPSFSIVIAVHEQTEELRNNLPALLTQQYEDYEVIVVDESKNEESEDVLEQQKAEHPHLYTTFLPQYQFQKNRRRLAFTIGVKAVKKDWVILTDITPPPPSDQWLAELEEYVRTPTVLLLGYVNKKSGDVSLRCFDDISTASKLITKTERGRISEKGKGWAHHLWRKSTYDFIVVRTSLAHELLKLFALDPWLLVSKER